MPDFTYTGIDKSGQLVTGRVDAPTEGDLRMLLRQKGIRPKKISRSGAVAKESRSAFGKAFVKRVGLQTLVLFTRQLQLLISSGIPLLQGLSILHEQSTDTQFKHILGTVKDKVSQGSFFWESLSAFPEAFPKLYCALIRAGESSGSLDQMLKRLTKYLEDSEKLRRMIKGALSYPIIIIAVGIGVIGLMMVFVIPKFEELMTSSGQKLPELTQIVMDMSRFCVKYVLHLLAGIGVTVYLIIQYFRSVEGKAVGDRLLFRVPFFGKAVQQAAIARFSRTLQTLLMSGINVIDAIDICRATVDNIVIEDAVKKIRVEIEGGKTIGMVISKMDVFPRMAVQMISVGESTGNLDKMLEKVADYYEAEVEAMVSGMSKMIEPLVLVFLGGTVGALMIAMYLPIFQLAGSAN
jgi:type IV pilus assembly protein PilC